MNTPLPHIGALALVVVSLIAGTASFAPLAAGPDAPAITARATAADPLEGEPGKTLTVGFIVTNHSDSTQTVWAVVQTPRAWRVVVSDPPFTLGAHTSDLRLVTFSIPATAAEGTYEIRYTTAPAESPGDSSAAATTVHIAFVRQITLKPTDSPKKVVSGSTYRSSFSITNNGNRPENLRLRAEALDNRFLIQLNTATLQLAPQESRTITATVETQPNGGDAYFYRIDLLAETESDSTVRARASSTVQIMPGLRSVEARYQNFPFVAAVRWGGEEGRSRPQFEFSGMGPLSIDGSDQMELLVRTPDLQGTTILGYRDEYYLGYRSDRWDAFLGDRNFILSPLTEYGRYAFGGGAAYREGNVSLTAFANQDRYLASRPREVGGSAGYALSSDIAVAANYLYRQESATSSIVTARAFFENIFNTSANVELGRDFGDGKDNAVALRWNGYGTWGSFAADYIHAGPGYNSYYSDIEFKSAGVTVYPVGGIRLDANIRDEIRNLDRDPAKYSAPRALYYEIGVGYANIISAYFRSNGYSDRMPTPRYDRLDNSILLQAAYAAPQLGILGQIEAGNQHDRLSGTILPFRRYALSSSVSPSPLQNYGFTIEYEQLGAVGNQAGSDRLSGSLRAAITLAANTRALAYFFGAKTLTGFEQNYSYLDLALEQRLPFGHTIGAHVRQSVYTPQASSGDIAYLFEYRIPLSLPLKFSSTSSPVRGMFRNAETGAPVSGAILTLDGAAVLTDPSGEFLFPDVKPGTHLLDLDRAGIGMEFITIPQLPLEINVIDEPVDLEITLVHGASVKGAVLLQPASGGEPADTLSTPQPIRAGLADVIIELTCGSRLHRRRTDSQGRFDFSGLPPGQWTLRVMAGEGQSAYRFDPETSLFTLGRGEQLEFNPRAQIAERKIRMLESGKTLTETPATMTPAQRVEATQPPPIPRAPSAVAVRLGKTSGYAVRVATEESKSSAVQKANRFGQSLGVCFEVRPVKKQGRKTSYEVLVGSFSTKSDADAMAALLRSGTD